MKRKLAYSLYILSVLLITSCGTTKLPGKDISDFEAGRKAIVRADNMPLWAEILLWKKPVVRIRAVDGKDVVSEIFSLNDQIVLDAGLHKIEFSCSDRAGYNEKDFTEILELDLKSHHEYLVDCWFESGFRVEEKSLE
ncbi:MAG: hypothetical protein OEV42_12250 [Deltaproteobacteria bacterium]|nr:hypothetical protein [Deltaproteobacteria bacterium]